MATITPSRHWIRFAFVGYWVTLATLTHLPKLPHAASAALVYDKIVHAVAFGILAALAWWAWPPTEPGQAVRRAAMWFVILAVYAAADELLQPLTGRSCELADWIADIVGIILGLGAAHVVRRRAPRLTPRRPVR